MRGVLDLEESREGCHVSKKSRPLVLGSKALREIPAKPVLLGKMGVSTPGQSQDSSFEVLQALLVRHIGLPGFAVPPPMRVVISLFAVPMPPIKLPPDWP